MRNKLFYGKPAAEWRIKFLRSFRLWLVQSQYGARALARSIGHCKVARKTPGPLAFSEVKRRERRAPLRPKSRKLVIRDSIVAIAAATMIASLTGCSPDTAGDQQAASITVSNVTLTAAQREKIQTITVATTKYHKTTATTGAVDFDNDQATSVLAPFGGPVSRLLVAVGNQVKKGDPLAVVDSPDFAAAISAYRKALATAQTLRRVADMDKDLIEHNGVAQREEEQAQTDAINAEADRDAALQALVSLNMDPQAIKDLQAGRPISRPGGMINSPIAGTVVEKLITPGELLTAGSTPCFTVADLSRVWVMAQLFGSDLASISVGDPVEVESAIATNTFSGTVDNISALVDPTTRSVMVRVVVDNPGDFLKKQMYVNVRIQSRHESTGLLIPVSAVLRDDVNLPFVYVVQPDGSFARRHVTLGSRIGDQYDIPDGLQVGDQIVVDGAIFIQFMQNQ
jgi:cobalt-zinc-cadmium efflux system membrane fusion protein